MSYGLPKNEADMNREYLAQIIKLFTVKEKQARFLEFVDSPKRYDDFLHELLNDTRNIEMKYVVERLNGNQYGLAIAERLRKHGAGKKAYIVSENADSDGKCGDLKGMVSLVGWSTILYCVGTKLAFYNGHEGSYLILKAG